MKSMCDPFRPAAFKAVSLISKPCCQVLATIFLSLTGGCQGEHDPGSDMNQPASSATLSIKNPFAFSSPASASKDQKILTIASYNVENLFDQKDDTRNESYGDYRITPNTIGQSSNYGERAPFDRSELSFTEIKIKGIRKTLLGIDPSGPDIIGLVEIESRYALEELFESVKDLGYVAAQFSEWKTDMKPSAIGLGLLSKYPVISWDLVMPIASDKSETQQWVDNASVTESLSYKGSTPGQRPILRVEVSVEGLPLVVYVNHWKSKSAPESHRAAYARGLSHDIDRLLKDRPNAEYIVLGDLNSAYNESEIMESNHNDTNGLTGINDILKAGSSKEKLAEDPAARYNLVFEVDETSRPSAWYPSFGWSSLDHMIIGGSLYDGKGIDYVDNSFHVARPQDFKLQFLFTDNDVPKRWYSKHKGRKFTSHAPGGYSDHLPLWARFIVKN